LVTGRELPFGLPPKGALNELASDLAKDLA
jgi:hypothetical protein